MIRSLIILSEIIFSSSLLLFLSSLISTHYQSPQKKFLRNLLITALLGSLAISFTWIVTALRPLGIRLFSSESQRLFINIAWIIEIISTQALALFTENITKKRPSVSLLQKFFILVSSIIGLSFLINTIIYYYSLSPVAINNAPKIMSFLSYYLYLLFMPLAGLIGLHNLSKPDIPGNLKKYATRWFIFFIIPFTLFNALEVLVFNFKPGLVYASYIAHIFFNIILANGLISIFFTDNTLLKESESDYPLD